MTHLKSGPIHSFSGEYDDPLPQTETTGGVGIVNIDGLLRPRADASMRLTGGTSVRFLSQVISTMVRDSRLSSIVLRCDSMGGDFGGVPDLAQRIYESRDIKPIIAHADGWMAGSAFWLCSAATEVIATPSSPGIGGLGMVRTHFSHADYLEKQGVKVTLIASTKSPFKTEWNPYEPLTEAAKKHAQSQMDIAHAEMMSAVATYRRTDLLVAMRDFGQGRVLLSEDAKEAGLVDSVESFPDLIDRLGGTRR